jgi:mevalonate kinase
MVRFQHGGPTRLEPPAGWECQLVFTGKPESSTGECVDHVRKEWSRHGIWTDFADVTEALQKSVLALNQTGLKASIRQNHRLLHTLGVVPAPVARFIREVESRNGAAKVCGAGAVRGDGAGIVWMLPGDPCDDLIQAAGYTTLRVALDLHGVRHG